MDISAPADKSLDDRSMNSAMFWFAALAVVSVWMTIGNKIVMTAFDYPNYITFLQNGTAVACLVGARFFGLIQINAMRASQWKIFAMNAVLLVAQIVTSLKALPLVAIATTISFKNLVTCLTAVIESVVFGQRIPVENQLAMLLTTAGMFIYAGFDVDFNVMGYFWLSMNTLASVGNALWNKYYISKFTKNKEQTSEGISLIQQTETLPLVLVMASYNEEWEASGMLQHQTSTVLVVLFGTCLGGYAISVCYAKVFQYASGSSVMLASTVNKAISIAVAWFVFANFLTPQQIFGLGLCISGGVWYAIASKRPAGVRGFAHGLLEFLGQSTGYQLVESGDQ